MGLPKPTKPAGVFLQLFGGVLIVAGLFSFVAKIGWFVPVLLLVGGGFLMYWGRQALAK